jgi:hypothetical protein
MAVRWQRVSGSSMITRAGYDPQTETMEIEFTSGQTYTYEAVPSSVFNGLITASSPGKFYHANIKDAF